MLGFRGSGFRDLRVQGLGFEVCGLGFYTVSRVSHRLGQVFRRRYAASIGYARDIHRLWVSV